jgi:hypothetical protein
MTVEPLSPDEAKVKHAIPDQVIEAFNEMILRNLDGRVAIVNQEDVVSLIREKMKAARPDFNRREIFQERWLNVEEIYRSKGWQVEYDKPGFNESYDATFTFRKPKQ